VKQLQKKVDEALALLAETLPRHKKPIVMSSFGKDSMVLLYLVKLLGLKLPILFYREPFFPKKYEFANQMIAAEEYTVYDQPPLNVGMAASQQAIEVVSLYGTQGGPVHYVPTGIKDPEVGLPYLCGLTDLYQKPKGEAEFPWDLRIHGHKSSDQDPIFGAVPLKSKVLPGCVFPIADFTDADVWEFTLQEGIPINRKRYNEAAAWKEFDDITFNPDYFHACTACLDRRQLEKVRCPKTEQVIPNLGKQIYYVSDDMKRPSYFAEIS